MKMNDDVVVAGDDVEANSSGDETAVADTHAAHEVRVKLHQEPSAGEVWAQEDQDNNSRSHSNAPKRISLVSAYMILTTWSTSSSNVLYPYTFGVLGVAGGPLLMLIAFFVSWATTRWTIDAARMTGSETFGELGHALLGNKGRIIFEGSQILFQQLFLPVAIVISSATVQSLASYVGFTACNGDVVRCYCGCFVVGVSLIRSSRAMQRCVQLVTFASRGTG